ncbi:hypothetical protein BH11PSE11_BH11PSE11_12970 [soil metagenome]
MNNLLPAFSTAGRVVVLRACLLFFAACLSSSAQGATTASIASGSTVYNNSCASCHTSNAASNVDRISMGANNPALIQFRINGNFGGMGILSSLSATDISNVADYLGSVFFPQQGAPGVSVSPASIVFPSRAVNSSGGGTTLTVSNPGSGTLNISGITSSSNNFVVASGCSASLAPGASCFVTVTFAPKTAGPVSGSITIQTNASTSSMQVAVSGIGIGPYTGLWWNPNESGWGMSVTQQGTNIFLAKFTYDGAGIPTWYVVPSCPVTGKSCTGDMYSVTGGTSLATAWNGTAKLVNKVGTGTLAFTDNDNGVFTFTLNGVNGSKTISRQGIATGTTAPAVDYTALWWNPNESGWGVALTQQFSMIFVALYTYESNGSPVWYVASSCPVVAAGCSGDLYRVSGGSSPTVTWNGSNLQVVKVGTINFAFTDSSTGTMSYTINGVAGSRAIIRQLF